MSRISPSVGADANAPAAIAAHVIAYTTDDPGLTAGDTTTIADGDLFPAAEGLQAIEDLSAKINLILTALRTQGIIQS